MTRLLALTLLVVLSLQAVTTVASRITSLANDNAAGVDPTDLDSQIVSTTGTVTNWKIVKVEGEKYKFSVGDYDYVGVLDGKVIASINQEEGEEWIVRDAGRNLYTISPASAHDNGWTVCLKSGKQEVAIRPIVVVPTDPPRVQYNQLWRLELN
ncbi:MAG: hypothetical protein BYD32DRAFT_93447 [Podila humilis]|nr:MAG: hypothetical protein BYD32DRAFT_93447 [Podila humilis]